jgi:pimeloyl-ACP methyl ester carboxylesterase
VNPNLPRIASAAFAIAFAAAQLAAGCSPHGSPAGAPAPNAPSAPPVASTAPTPPVTAETELSSGQAGVAEARDATVNGVKLHYLTAGRGTPIVLLHGFAETSHMWLPLMGALAKNHLVIAPDLRGAGGSDKAPSGYDKKTMAADIHALVQALGHTRAKIVGHDIGLMVAYAYAAQYPTEVERVALMDAFLPGVGAWKDVWLNPGMWHFHFYGETPEKLVAGRERIYLEHFWNDFAADRTKSVPEVDRRLYAAAYAQPGAMHSGFEWFHAFQQDASDFETMSRTKLTMPMLVLAGAKAAGPFLVDQARLVATNVDGVVVPGAGHWLMEEAPREVIPRLVTFLDAVGASRMSAR